MKPYNGFSGKLRNISWQIQKQLKQHGELDWTNSPCCICQCVDGLIMPHLENYFDYKNYYPLCVVCHMRCHARFKAWNSWIAYLIEIRSGYTSKGYNSVISYFGTKENRMYFVQKEPQLFTPRPNCWWENLLDYQPNIFQKQIDKGNYSETYIEDSWKEIRKQIKV